MLMNGLCAQGKPKKSRSKSTTKAVTATSITTQPGKVNYAFIVSFISIGSGIDHKALEKLDKYLENNPKKPVYDKIQRGREGELEYRFGLKEFSTSEAKNFIAEVKKAVGTTDLVKFSENQER